MASEFSDTDFDARIFKICANIVSVGIIAICALEDQIIMSI
jgi:hypothetical protein